MTRLCCKYLTEKHQLELIQMVDFTNFYNQILRIFVRFIMRAQLFDYLVALVCEAVLDVLFVELVIGERMLFFMLLAERNITFDHSTQLLNYSKLS